MGQSKGKIREDETMSKKASKLQEKVMALKFRGKEIFKPLNAGWIDEHVSEEMVL